jgi:hypothetical protein
METLNDEVWLSPTFLNELARAAAAAQYVLNLLNEGSWFLLNSPPSNLACDIKSKEYVLCLLIFCKAYQTVESSQGNNTTRNYPRRRTVPASPPPAHEPASAGS